jgi:predicted anti-sigma-YlaC factor YlaD
MDKPPNKQNKELRFSRVSFSISLAVFLILFALLAFGSILGIVGIVRMLWKVLGGS